MSHRRELTTTADYVAQIAENHPLASSFLLRKVRTYYLNHLPILVDPFLTTENITFEYSKPEGQLPHHCPAKNQMRRVYDFILRNFNYDPQTGNLVRPTNEI